MPRSDPREPRVKKVNPEEENGPSPRQMGRGQRGASSVYRTYRVDDDVDAMLQELAFRERVSVNVIVNRGLRRFAEWDAGADRFGFVAIPRSLQARLFSSLSEEEARDIGDWAGNNVMTSLLVFFFKKIDFDTVLALMRMLSSKAGMFEFEYHTEPGVKTFIVKHDGGRIMSVYTEAFLKTLLKRCTPEDIESIITEDQVVATITVAKEKTEPPIPNNSRTSRNLH